MKEHQADSDHGSVIDLLETSLTRHAAIAAAAELTTAAVEADDTSSGYSSDSYRSAAAVEDDDTSSGYSSD